MIRNIYKARVNESTVRYRCILTDEPSPKGTDAARIRAYMFLQQVLDTPDLMYCGLAPFQTLTMYHSNASWVIELQAEVSES
jgi:hypothetical protein